MRDQDGGPNTGLEFTTVEGPSHCQEHGRACYRNQKAKETESPQSPRGDPRAKRISSKNRARNSDYEVERNVLALLVEKSTCNKRTQKTQEDPR